MYSLSASHVPFANILIGRLRPRNISFTATVRVWCMPTFFPGTGKSTTIFHVIESRIRAEGRVLITSIRNQAVDAVTEKVDSFGVLVRDRVKRTVKPKPIVGVHREVYVDVERCDTAYSLQPHPSLNGFPPTHSHRNPSVDFLSGINQIQRVGAKLWP